MSRPEQWCGCGRPLHYVDRSAADQVHRLVAQLGPLITVEVGPAAWRVPRHYIALHGLTAAELPRLAEQFGWPRLR